jgi:hypothetical protein
MFKTLLRGMNCHKNSGEQIQIYPDLYKERRIEVKNANTKIIAAKIAETKTAKKRVHLGDVHCWT